ncbi:UDP-N-acetyl-D-mannosamine dehydrogenase VpsB [Luteimonas pelagia]
MTHDTIEIRTLGIVGLGYIGLPTAAMFAASGLDVLGVDIDPTVRDAVNAGSAHIEEGDLDDLVASVVGQGRLRAVAAPEPCDAFIIAVPTPVDHRTHAPDISYVEAAARGIAPVIAAGNLVILESTSPVGTTERVREILRAARPDLDFGGDGRGGDVHLAYCPERIIPGRMLEELASNDRIIGGMSPEASAAATALYKRFVQGACIESDARTAEMVKLTENAFRDTNIAFANELSMICDTLSIDAWEVIRLANRHPRVSILSPGAGVGGHCIAVDPWFIVSSAPEQARMIRTAREVNTAKTASVVDKLDGLLRADADAVLACFGLSYKADVDDFRESPALEIAKELTRRHPGRVLAVDPFAEALGRQDGDAARMLEIVGPEDAQARAGIVAILVPHARFRALALGDDQRVVDVVGIRR